MTLVLINFILFFQLNEEDFLEHVWPRLGESLKSKAMSLELVWLLLEIHTKFIRTATYGETLQIHTSVQEWKGKVFVHKHVVMRGDTVLCEGTEVRAFCIKHPDDPDRIKTIPVPEDIQSLCS